MDAIIEHLKVCGEQLDADIATALHLPLHEVRSAVEELSANGKVMSCFVTRYNHGKKLEGWSCRLSGFIPSAAPGRKSGSQKPGGS